MTFVVGLLFSAVCLQARCSHNAQIWKKKKASEQNSSEAADIQGLFDSNDFLIT